VVFAGCARGLAAQSPGSLTPAKSVVFAGCARGLAATLCYMEK
jgi:hypothetical protein